ncbi:ATP-dependent DNA helicase [Armatimonas rosea]|uniref:ATP-dependent DNA helicase DinG n=1 Tax=Armatimonas rosea TaxID=685828 RepID=A0A7W9SSN4_ARMRO|nr:ATP-dependent DNA helicase [Armatimonas rosea]MBB6052130.1 ATP-dependent DNA helicase DinG [Armatimonas rosea]
MSGSLTRVFGKNGPLAKRLPGFAPRAEQTALAEAIATGLSESRPCLAEAGTGVGKSLAYLVPLLRWLEKTDGRAVISTHTLGLQGQLIERDIPAVLAALESPIEAGVLKGRQNFLCWQELEIASTELWTFGDPVFKNIQRWANESDSGDVAELDFSYPGWSDIAAHPDTCRHRECRHYDKCFYYKARRNAEKCQLLVVNHALFFADLRLQRQAPGGPTLIPTYDAVVFDEAHHVDDVATRAFGLEWGSRRVPILLARCKRLPQLKSQHLAAIEAIHQRLLDPYLGAAKYEGFMHEVEAPQFRELRDAVCTALDALAKDLVNIAETTTKTQEKEKAVGLAKTATRLSTELSAFHTEPQDDSYFLWYHNRQLRGGGILTTLVRTPYEIAPALEESLYSRIERVSFVSATLATGGGFESAAKRLGLVSAPSPVAPTEQVKPVDDEDDFLTPTPLASSSHPLRPDEGGFQAKGVASGASGGMPVTIHALQSIQGSPFDYERNGLLYVPRHLGPPASTDEYADRMLLEVQALISLAKGRTFVLFTSHRMLTVAKEQLKASLGYPVFAQGEAPNARLVESFTQAGNGVLLGTSSFWEGVDVPGEALSLVIMDKLPFPTPDSPPLRAREERIKKSGGDAFNEFSMPVTELRLKQGFGRLLRTTTDRGVVAILDARLWSKAYGRKLLDALPPCPRTDQISAVAQFFVPVPSDSASAAPTGK